MGLDQNQNKNLEGIGGWLAFFSFTLIIAPLRLLSDIYSNYVPMITNGTLSRLKTPGSPAYHPLWLPLIAFEITTSIAFAIFLVWLIGKFFQKKKEFPKKIIMFYVLNIAFSVITDILIFFIPSIASEYKIRNFAYLVASILASSIWIAYFLRSKRVKNTFIK